MSTPLTWEEAPELALPLRPAGPPDPAELGPWFDPPDPTRPIGCALRPDALVLVFPWLLVHVARGGRILRAVPAKGMKLLAWDADGARLLLQQSPRLFVLDLRTGRWEEGFGPGFRFMVMEERYEDGFLVDAPRGRALEIAELARYPEVYVASPDGELLWIMDKSARGGVYEAETGALALPADDIDMFPDDVVPPADDAGFWSYHPDWALARRADGRLVYVAQGLVYADEGRPQALARRPCASAFDRAGRELLLARRDEAQIVAVERPLRALGRIPLAGLAPALAATPGLPAMPEAEQAAFLAALEARSLQ